MLGVKKQKSRAKSVSSQLAKALSGGKATKAARIREKTKLRTQVWRKAKVDVQRRRYENVIRSAARRRCGTADSSAVSMLSITELLLKAQYPRWKELGLMKNDYCAYLEPVGSIERVHFGSVEHVASDADGTVQWVLFKAHDCRGRLRKVTRKHQALPRLVAVRANRVTLVPDAIPRSFEFMSRVDQTAALVSGLAGLLRDQRVIDAWREVNFNTKVARQRRPIGPKSAKLKQR